jgi:hypothetical protein
LSPFSLQCEKLTLNSFLFLLPDIQAINLCLVSSGLVFIKENPSPTGSAQSPPPPSAL